MSWSIEAATFTVAPTTPPLHSTARGNRASRPDLKLGHQSVTLQGARACSKIAKSEPVDSRIPLLYWAAEETTAMTICPWREGTLRSSGRRNTVDGRERRDLIRALWVCLYARKLPCGVRQAVLDFSSLIRPLFGLFSHTPCRHSMKIAVMWARVFWG